MRIPSRYLTATGVAIVLVVVLTAATAEFVDLQVYRFAWDALRSGRDIYGTLPRASDGLSLPYIYPPFGLISMAPLLVLPWSWSVTATLLLSVAALAVTLYVFLGARSLVVIALPLALLVEPVRETLQFGQINIWLMALVAVDCLLPKTRWPRGMLVGIAAAIKLTPAAFLLFFLVRKDFRAIGTTVATAATVTGIGFLLAPESSMRYWFAQPFHSGGFAGSPFATNQSIPAELARIGLPPVASTVIFVVLAGAVLAAAVSVMRRVAMPTALVVNAAAALLVAPISWSHHWVWAVPALALLAMRAWRAPTRRRRLVVCGGYLLVLIGPHFLVPAGRGVERYWTVAHHLIGNNYLFVCLALFGAAVWAVRRRPARELVWA